MTGLHLWRRYNGRVQRCARPGCSALRRIKAGTVRSYEYSGMFGRVRHGWSDWRPMCRGGSTADRGAK